MYGIFTYNYHENQQHVVQYTMHGFYGSGILKELTQIYIEMIACNKKQQRMSVGYHKRYDCT